MRKLRIGIIGLGGVGRVHLAAYRASERVDVVAVADASPGALDDELAAPFARYASVAELLAAGEIDIACVATPPATHEAIVAQCADAGVHVLCEKPLTLTPRSAATMIARCESAGVRLHYGASYRFLPALVEARRLIASGALGRIRLMRESVVDGGGPGRQAALPPGHYPLGGPGGTGMGLIDHGVHLVDLFSWLTGSAVTEAHGRGNVSGETLAPEFLSMRLANGAIGLLAYDDGTFSSLLPGEGVFSAGASWGADGYAPGGAWDANPGSIHIHGERGALRVFHYANLLYHRDESGLRQVPIVAAPPPAHFRAQIEQFAAEILHGLPPSCPPQDGLAALQVVLAAYAA